jgi:hypothetical protein
LPRRFGEGGTLIYIQKILLKVLGAFIVLLLVASCGERGSDLPGTAPPAGLTASTNPSVRILGNNSNVVISFNKTMDITSLNLSGSLLNGNGFNVSWASNANTNDTLLLTPTGTWNLGGSRTLNIIADEQGGAADQIILNLVYDVYTGTGFFVSNDNGLDTNNGLTPETAKKTIAGAIAVAELNAPAWIAVDGGTYNVLFSTFSSATHIKIETDGVSLYGGYNAEFTDRDTDMYTSVITNNSTVSQGAIFSSNTAVEIGNSITPATVIDGFTINATTQGSQWFTSAVWVKDGGAPTIQNNVLNGGTGQYPYGVSILVNASPVIQNNEIYGGTVVKSNSGGTGYSIAITAYSNSNPIIRYNKIGAGTGDELSAGILTYESSTAEIHNNMIGAGAGTVTYGLWVNSSSPIIRNNTIYAGNGVERSYAVGFGRFVNTDPVASPTIENNNLFTSGAAMFSACIVEFTDAGSRAASVKNNNLFDCPTTTYWASVGVCPGNADGDNNSLTCTLAEMQSGLGAASSGNVAIDLTTSFLNVDGFDNNMLTMDDNDWRLQSFTSNSVKAGGLNGGDLGWGFNLDLDGSVRPGTGAPWSIGAYEP